MKLKLVLGMFIFLTNVATVFSKVKQDRNISYLENSKAEYNQLDIYYPENVSETKDVMVFIHGGSWNSGKKNTYWWLGRNMAGKNVVEVNINYGLSPEFTYEQMATDCAAALKWVKNNIEKYGGNTSRIFVMGHSAGGHLASLIDNDPRFFEAQGIENPIHAVILNDGFGLDMNEYLNHAEQNDQTTSFLRTFSKDPETWTKGSPLNYFENFKRPYLILVGEKTYPAIKIQSKRLYEKMGEKSLPVEYYMVCKKKHIGMITQLILGGNEVYNTILNFMRSN
ncbi:MAG: alpha/beta hydrolase [Daejeonella sp.]